MGVSRRVGEGSSEQVSWIVGALKSTSVKICGVAPADAWCCVSLQGSLARGPGAGSAFGREP